jgi:hypothetical protein
MTDVSEMLNASIIGAMGALFYFGFNIRHYCNFLLSSVVCSLLNRHVTSRNNVIARTIHPKGWENEIKKILVGHVARINEMKNV